MFPESLPREQGKALSKIIISLRINCRLGASQNVNNVMCLESKYNSAEYQKISFHLKPYDSNDITHNERILFKQEIEDRVDSLRIHNADVIIEQIMDDLKNATRHQKWFPFGSYLSGMACKNSDIDLYCESQHSWQQIGNRIIRKLKKNPRFKKIKFIESAQVPVVKLVHVGTGKKCDISFTSKMGIQTSKLTKLYLSLNPHLKNFTLYLRYLLQKYELYGTGKITTQILFWMVVYFMQEKKLLPPVVDIRNSVPENKKYFISELDCSVPDSFSYRCNEPGSLYLLLRDFSKFYRDFDFLKYIICPYMACSFRGSEFENTQIRKEEFFNHLKKLWDMNVMNIQNPTDLDSNLSKQVTFRILNSFKLLCYEICELFCNYSEENLQATSLEKILPACLKLQEIHFQPNNNLMKFNQIRWDYGKPFKDCTIVSDREKISYAINAILKMLQTIFEFRVKCIKSNKVRPVVYFECEATKDTSYKISSLFSLPYNQKLNDISLGCQFFEEKNVVQMLILSDNYFNTFLRRNIKIILYSIVKGNLSV